MLHTRWDEAAIFRPHRSVSLAHQITDQIRRRIVTGDLAAGRRLPSIRRLAKLYGVSTPTIESAVHALVAIGLVRVSRGVGIYVTRPREHTVLLNYVWRNAETRELAIVRAAIDERAPALAAREVHANPRPRQPRRLADINFFVVERSMQRGDPESFVKADLAFHRSILDALRGIEIGGALYARVGERLRSRLISVADVMMADDRLHEAHIALSAAILDGHVGRSARLGRQIAAREQAALERTLG